MVNKRSPKERDRCGEGIDRMRAKDGKKGIVRDRRRNFEEVFGAGLVRPLPFSLSNLGGPSGIVTIPPA